MSPSLCVYGYCMIFVDGNRDTICAIATAYGRSAVGMVKLSGDDAREIFGRIFRSARWHNEAPMPRYAYYGWICDPNSQEDIDDVVATYFAAPASYTGEDTIEITAHGSPFILKEILRLLVASGARLALPGEFTKRAVVHGKLDLSQAEAVVDVIASSSRAALRMSLTQMRGGFSKKINSLRESLVHFCALVELELDFSEEEVEFAQRETLAATCQSIVAELRMLRDSFERGRVIKQGIPIAIAGATNAGKSTLLNTLLDDDKAIVSDIHGTTRDTIEDTMLIEGREYRFIDTAGIRATDDPIEMIGIQRSFEKIKNAALVLWMIDATDEAFNLEFALQLLQEHTALDNICAVINKRDLVTDQQLSSLQKQLTVLGIEYQFVISARKRMGVDLLTNFLSDHFSSYEATEGEIIISNIRHAEALSEAISYLERVLEAMELGVPGDLFAQDLRLAVDDLGAIVGKISSDTLLHQIFSSFCIGK